MPDPIPKSPREKDEHYLAWIRQQPCCLCGDDVHVEAAHLRVGSINHGKDDTGMQMKSSDKWALPLCTKHHRMQHAAGNELVFWASFGIDPFALSLHYQRQRQYE
jgi:hypothetical protein